MVKANAATAQLADMRALVVASIVVNGDQASVTEPDLTIIKIEYTRLRTILELTDLYTRDTDFKKVIINSIKEINSKANSIKLEAHVQVKIIQEHLYYM